MLFSRHVLHPMIIALAGAVVLAADSRADFYFGIGCGHPGGGYAVGGPPVGRGEFSYYREWAPVVPGEAYYYGYGPGGYAGYGGEFARQIAREAVREAVYQGATEGAGVVGGTVKGATTTSTGPSLSDLDKRLTDLQAKVKALDDKVGTLAKTVDELVALEKQRQQAAADARLANIIRQAVQQEMAGQRQLIYDALEPLARDKPDPAAAREALKKLKP